MGRTKRPLRHEIQHGRDERENERILNSDHDDENFFDEFRVRPEPSAGIDFDDTEEIADDESVLEPRSDETEAEEVSDDSECDEGKMTAADAEKWIAMFQIFNDFSDPMSRDVSDIQSHRILRQVTATGTLKMKRKLLLETTHQQYSFCSDSKCGRLLRRGMVCLSRTCSRKGLLQRNHSKKKVVVYYELRTQLQEILNEGLVDPESIKNRSGAEKLNGLTRQTPKFRELSKSIEQMNPDNHVTLLISLATDGFRKTGNSRSEIWPIFCTIHDLERRREEHRPESTLLLALVKSPNLLKQAEFRDLFRKVNADLENVTSNPIEFRYKGRKYYASLKLFNVVIDMDCSKKIFGVPNWRAYNGCSRCNIEGEMVLGTSGKMNRMSWFPKNPTTNYGDNLIGQIMPVKLPPPWSHGFDFLHLFSLGVNRDRLREMFESDKKRFPTVLSASNIRYIEVKFPNAPLNVRLVRTILLKTASSPCYLWLLSYRATKEGWAAGKFVPFPVATTRTIENFCFDALRLFLPEDLVGLPSREWDGVHDFSIDFGSTLEEKRRELGRRQALRTDRLNEIREAIALSLQHFRGGMHYDRTRKELVPCRCSTDACGHYKWKDVESKKITIESGEPVPVTTTE